MRSGFSLVEVLVALLLFALIAAAGAAAIAVSADNRETMAAANARLARLQRLEALLRADLGQAADRTVRETDGRVRPYAFTGGGDGLLFDFVRRGRDNPAGEARAGLQRLDYRLVDGRLERRVYPHLDGTRPGEPIVLHDGVSGLRLTFVSRGQQGPGWSGSADRPLPDAVRLEMDLDDVGHVAFSILVSAP